MTETSSSRPAAQPNELDHLRPTMHFAPQATWMNDPNGLLLHRGTYHLFFQNNPYGSTWGNMSWGHATSTDLLTWREHDVAIPADEHEEIFSGSAVVDTRNTAGFAGPDQVALVAIYTSNYTAASPRAGIQAQSLAYSLDEGATWTKHIANPVLDENRTDFRDPKVFWHGSPADGHWVMVAVHATDHRVAVYSSPDLHRWTQTSTFGPAHAVGGVWECPDLFQVRVRGSDLMRWVLIVSLNPGGIAGGSGTQYFVGDFDGTTFVPDRLTDSGDPGDYDWLDHGRDYYAGVSFHGTPAGAPITIAWASNWDYANTTPTHPWRSAMALPRTLELVPGREGRHVLAQQPVLAETRDGCLITHLQVPTRPGHSSQIVIADSSGRDQVLLDFDGDTKSMTSDRSRSGTVDFHAGFTGTDTAPLQGAEATDVLIVVDGCVLEVYLDGGLATLTQLVFPRAPLTQVSRTHG